VRDRALVPSAATLLIFAASTLALLAVPGPSVLFVVARTVEQGRRAGLVSVLGLETGALLHVAAASAGLSAIVASSPAAFAVLR
jgi:threonine/homoserine/homoserine lactone efflux protein